MSDRQYMLRNAEAKYLFGEQVHDPVFGAVTRSSALRHSAVYRCVSVVAASIAICPGVVQRQNKEDKFWEDRDDHPSWNILNISPDPAAAISPFQFFEQKAVEALLSGNAYGEIQQNWRGQAKGIIPLEPDCVEEDWDDDGNKIYNVWADADRFRNRKRPDVTLQADEVFHLRNFSLDGNLTGVSPMRCMAGDINLGLHSRNHNAQFFKKGRPMGFIGTDDWVKGDEEDKFHEHWNKAYKDPWSVAVLGNKARWWNITLPAKDIQLIETREFQIAEIARFFGVPPFLVGLMEKQGFKSTEQMMRAFVQGTLLRWIRNLEAECRLKFFTRDEQFNYRVRFDMSELQRGDTQAMAESFERKVRHGGATINEWRLFDGLPPIKGGDTPLVMASQLGTLEDVLAGKYIKSATKGDSTGSGAGGNGGTKSRLNQAREKCMLDGSEGRGVLVTIADQLQTTADLFRNAAKAA